MATISKSVTVADGGTYTLVLNAIPTGSTVTPVNDIQTWLHCGDIWDKTYTTIAQVLNDTSTLQALIASNNAADYMARSTSWASSVTTNANAMTYIGANNYCANKLLANNTWLNAILSSTYMENVLNTKVPTMTSDTTPSGECFQVNKHDDSNYAAYKCFDGNSSTFSFFDNGTYSSDGYYIGYDFNKVVNVKKYTISRFSASGKLPNIRLIGSNDKTNWTACTSYKTPDDYSTGITDIATANHSFRYWAIQGNNKYWAPFEIQFFGRA